MRRVKDYFLPVVIGMFLTAAVLAGALPPEPPLLKGQWLQTIGSRMFCLL